MLICAQEFIDNLKEKNLNFQHAETETGNVVVDFPYQGKVTKCIFSGEEGQYFSMYLVYERVPEDKVADLIFLCNQLNAEYKWVTYYVDNDNDFVMHDDAIVSADSAGAECFELLVRMLKISEDIKPRIMKAIYA